MTKKIKIAKIVATLGPIGYLPAPGTMGSLAALPLIYYLGTSYPDHYFLFTLIIQAVGSCTVRHALPFFKELDPAPIIIDEVAGMFIACLPLSRSIFFSWNYLFLAFVLFRFFDITKIGPVGFFERRNGAEGVMGDDAVAGFITAIILFIIVYGPSLV